MPLRTDPRTGVRIDLPDDAALPVEKRTHFYVRALTSWGIDFVRAIFEQSGVIRDVVKAGGEELELELGERALMAILSRDQLFEILRQGLCGWGNFFETAQPGAAEERCHEFVTESHPVLGKVPTDATIALLPITAAAWLAGQIISRAFIGPEQVRG